MSPRTAESRSLQEILEQTFVASPVAPIAPLQFGHVLQEHRVPLGRRHELSCDVVVGAEGPLLLLRLLRGGKRWHGGIYLKPAHIDPLRDVLTSFLAAVPPPAVQVADTESSSPTLEKTNA